MRNNVIENTLQQLEILRSISSSIASSIELDNVLQDAVNVVVKKLNYYGCVIYLKEESTNRLFSKTVSETWYVKVALKFIPIPFDKLNVSLLDDQNLVVRTFLDNRPYEEDDLKKFVVPAVTDRVSDIIQKITNTKKIICLPIAIKDNPIGVIMFTKNSTKSFEEDILVLKAFSDQIGIAIVNARLFEQVSSQVRLLTKQNKDLESLYTLTSNISKSLNVDVVSQTAVNSLPQDTSMIGAILNLFDEEKQELYVKAVTSNQTSYAVEKIIGNIKQYKIDINDRQFDENISRKAFVMDKIYSSTNLADFISPPVPKSMVPAIEKLLKISSVVLYPLKRRDKVIGTIAYFLTKEDYAQLPQNEKNLYATYTAQIASALENSFLLKNLEEARAKIEEAYKKEKDMMDILGHELRTPLTVARNAVLMIDMEFQKPQPDMSAVNDLLEKAKENIKREISTLQTVLSTTRLENDRAQINYVKVDAKDVVHDSIEALGREAEKKKLQIKTELPEKEIFAWAGREQIQEIMDNLLSNAIKYTEKGEITISITEEGDYISFRVKDTGEGVPENEIKNLGKKFHRVNPYVQSNGGESDMNIVRPGGTGIGLYVVKGFLEKMGGKFGVESKLGEGSVFTASLQKYSGQDLSAKTDKNT